MPTVFRLMNGEDIRRWRTLNRIKQEALATMLGVSHVAVSKWENGHTRPSKAMILRLEDAMNGVHRGKLAAEIAFTAPQQQMKVLTRGRNMQLVGISKGFLGVFPEFRDFRGMEMRSLVVNEALHYCQGSDLFKDALRGDVIMLTGVSNRVLSIGSNVHKDFRLRWHTIVRHMDDEIIHEVIFEPCPTNTKTGFERVIRRDEIGKA